MPGVTTRAELEIRLRAAARRLVARQAVRAGFSGVAVASVALALAVLFLDLLPRLLFGLSAGSAVLLAVCAAGFGFGVVRAWRHYHIPTLQETALSLQARLEHDSSALAAALRVPETDEFLRPLLVQASGALQEAEHAPAPVLISTRRLVLVPLIALVAAIGFVAAINSPPPTAPKPLAAGAPEARRDAWSSIDTGATRSATDREAYRKALGMEETAMTLSQAAGTLRDVTASDETKQRALDDARKALADADGEPGGFALEDLPAELPGSADEVAELADTLQNMASGLGSKALELKAGKTGSTEDSGTDGEFKLDNVSRNMVPFPVVKIAQGDFGSKSLATQTPARRALAERAMKAFERIQDH